MKINLEDALSQLEDARFEDQDEMVANALFKVAVASLERRRLDQALEALDEAEHLCRKLDNPEGLAQVHLRQGDAFNASGRPREALERLEAALIYFVEQDRLTGRVGALERMARAHDLMGAKKEAAGRLQEGLDLLGSAEDEVGQLLFAQQLAPLLRGAGDWEGALDAYGRMGRLADSLGDPQRAALAAVGMAACHEGQGRLDQARRSMARAGDIYDHLGQLQLAGQARAKIARLDQELAKQEDHKEDS